MSQKTSKKFGKGILAALLLLSMLLTACGANTAGTASKTETAPAKTETSAPTTTPEVAQGGTIIIRAGGDPMGWNPDALPDDNGYPIFQNIFNRLVKMDASKNVIPDLATSWEVLDEGKTLTFSLAKNAKWQDGKDVTAEDVKYTFDYIKANKTYLLNTKMEEVDNITVDDPHTVTFHLKNPNVSMVADLGWYACFIMPKHILDNGTKWEDNKEWAQNPVGSGPFKLQEFQQGKNVTLVPNPDYFGGAPKLDKVIYTVIPDNATAVQALLNGEIDVLESLPATSIQEVEAHKELRMILNKYPSPMRLIFNMNHEKVKNPAIRKAIALCINRDEISKKIFMGVQTPEYSMYPEFIEWAANTADTAPKFNIDEAKKVLEEAGLKKDADGYYVRGLEIEVFEAGNYPDAAKLMVATLKEAGIEMKINVSEYNAWADKCGAKRDFIIELQGGFMGPDPQQMYFRYGSGQSGNWGGYANSEFDKLCLEGNAVLDQAKRAECYKAAQKILAQDLPFIPVVNFASYDVNNTKFINLPIDGAGKWGWQEYVKTEMVK